MVGGTRQRTSHGETPSSWDPKWVILRISSKANFPGGWSGSMCNICGFLDTDEHIFHCPGYQDLLSEDMNYSMFWDEEILNDTVRLKRAACSIVGIIERLSEVQGMKDAEL